MPILPEVQEFSNVRELIKAAKRGATNVKLKLPQENTQHTHALTHDIQLLALFLTQKDCAISNLDISGNAIGSAGGRVIREALAHNHTLEHLNISDNKLGSREVGLLAGSLSRNTHLRQLNVAANIEPNAAEKPLAEAMLGELVKNNTQLHTLDISGNNFDDGHIFTAAMSQNSTIHTLNIAGNDFTDTNISACTQKEKTNKELAPLRIITNAISGKNIQAEPRISLISRAQKLVSREIYKTFLQTPDSEGKTPLQHIIACHSGDTAVQLINATLSTLPESEQMELLQHTNSKGENLLHDAARKGDSVIAKFLIGKNVDASARSAETQQGTKFVNWVRGKGSSPADLARAHNNYSLAEILQRAKNQQQSQGRVER